MVLSNKMTDGRRAMYKLLNTVRVQGTTQDAYNAVYETQDKEGHRGVTLSKEIVKVSNILCSASSSCRLHHRF